MALPICVCDCAERRINGRPGPFSQQPHWLTHFTALKLSAWVFTPLHSSPLLPYTALAKDPGGSPGLLPELANGATVQIVHEQIGFAVWWCGEVEGIFKSLLSLGPPPHHGTHAAPQEFGFLTFSFFPPNTWPLSHTCSLALLFFCYQALNRSREHASVVFGLPEL